MAHRFLQPAGDVPTTDAGPVAQLVPLFAAYVIDGGPNERAAVAGFDRHGRLCAFAEVMGNAGAIDTMLPAFRSILAQSSVTEIVMAHSHPGESSTPSPRDRQTTNRLAALARLAGAMLVDHLVFGNDGAFSIVSGQRLRLPGRLHH